MKKIIAVCTMAILSTACSKKSEQSKNPGTENYKENISDSSKTAQSQNHEFDINTIKTSTADLGVFPYLSPPEGYTYGYEKKLDSREISDFDKEYFAVNGKFILVEGKTFKSRIQKDKSDGKQFNSLIVDKSYEKAILDLGGVIVNNVPVPRSEIDRVGDKELIDKKYGHSLDYNLLDDVKTYVIKTKDSEIWIQYTLMNDVSGNITILKKSNLNTLEVKKITAEEMQKEIVANGKAVLNINFDTDKAILKPDGETIVNEIFTLLTNNPKLNLSIEGHTDNTGSVTRNKQLSVDRAKTVMYALAGKGIDIKRLKSNGFGSEKNVASNDTESNKAKNRRVELVKF